MGTLNWTVTKWGGNNPRVYASGQSASGAFTTSGAAANVTNLSPKVGDIVALTASAAMWVNFGGRTAAVGTGHYLPAEARMDFEVQTGDAGTVSAIDA